MRLYQGLVRGENNSGYSKGLKVDDVREDDSLLGLTHHLTTTAANDDILYTVY